MKNRFIAAAIATLTGLAPAAQGQEGEEPSAEETMIDTRIAAGLGFGALSYFGEIGYGTHKDLINFATERRAFTVTGTKRMDENFGVSGTLLFGNLSKSERSTLPERNMNFKSFVFQLDGQFVYHFDNGTIMKTSVEAAPYVSAGIGFFLFNPKGDLYSASGMKYHYWTDGTIRDKAQDATDASTAKEIKRDFTYETELDSAGENGNFTLTIPVTLGYRFRITENVEADVKGTLHFTLSDYLDNFKNEADGGPDMFSYLGVSIRYYLPFGAEAQ